MRNFGNAQGGHKQQADDLEERRPELQHAVVLDHPARRRGFEKKSATAKRVEVVGGSVFNQGADCKHRGTLCKERVNTGVDGGKQKIWLLSACYSRGHARSSCVFPADSPMEAPNDHPRFRPRGRDTGRSQRAETTRPGREQNRGAGHGSALPCPTLVRADRQGHCRHRIHQWALTAKEIGHVSLRDPSCAVCDASHTMMTTV